MSNPLIDKYFELYPEKKEEPKPDYYKGEKSYTEELEEIEFPPEWSTTSVTPTTINPNSVGAITAANPYPKLTSYDTHSGENYFLEVAEKVKNKDARVTSVGFNQERAGIFSTGMTTITFEVQVWDTP